MIDVLLHKIFMVLPKDLLSQAFGVFANLQNPRFIAVITIRVFIWLYRIPTDNATRPISSFKSLQDFFLRELQPEARPLGSGIVSPADGRIRAAGKIETNKIYSIKGKDYSLESLVGTDYAQYFAGGSFINIYLSPADYHHVHVPCAGHVLGTKFIAGKLWPVTNWALRTVKDLYSENARTVTLFEHEGKLWCLVMVAAFNVGQIKLHYLESAPAYQKNTSAIVMPDKTIELSPGQLFGSFLLGSSVLLFAQGAEFQDFNFESDQPIKVKATLV